MLQIRTTGGASLLQSYLAGKTRTGSAGTNKHLIYKIMALNNIHMYWPHIEFGR